MTIRTVNPDEAERLGDFLRDVFIVTYGNCSSPENVAQFLEQHYSTTAQSEKLASPSLITFVLSEGEDWAGVGQLRLPDAPGAAAFLSSFFFDARFHGRGHAQRLLAHVADSARSAGASVLQLSAWENAPQAIRFYQKCGFARIGSIDFIIGADVLEDWLMQLPL